jgi:uncharacterized protein
MKFTWHEAKRRSNLKKHGLDFVDVPRFFDGPMLVFEDDRESYGEERLIGIGMLDAIVVLIVHVESIDTFLTKHPRLRRRISIAPSFAWLANRPRKRSGKRPFARASRNSESASCSTRRSLSISKRLPEIAAIKR